MPWSAARPIPSVLTRLEAGMYYRLVLIVAPAGSGKTRWLRQWAAWRLSSGLRPLAWASLTDQDNSLSVFLPHLVSAIAGIDAELDRWIRLASQHVKLPLPAESDFLQSISTEDYLIDLLNTLAQAPGEFALILDDYHRIDNPEIHHTIAFLLEYLPPPVHLYLAARRQPPLRLAHLLARREMIEIGADELASDLD